MIRLITAALGIGPLAGFVLSPNAQELAEPDWRAAAAEHGWRLFELSPERRSLEQIFVEFTTRETTEDAA